MANFAIAADENVIARGNKLIEELQEPGEKKGVTLNRLFDLVSATQSAGRPIKKKRR